MCACVSECVHVHVHERESVCEFIIGSGLNNTVSYEFNDYCGLSD